MYVYLFVCVNDLLWVVSSRSWFLGHVTRHVVAANHTVLWRLESVHTCIHNSVGSWTRSLRETQSITVITASPEASRSLIFFMSFRVSSHLLQVLMEAAYLATASDGEVWG